VNNKKVFLKDVLTEMRKLDERKKPIPFTITVRTYNKQNRFGGKLCTYIGARLRKSAFSLSWRLMEKK